MAAASSISQHGTTNVIINTKEFFQFEDKQSADAKAADLMDHLNKNRNKRWEETVKGIDFTHSSRKAWKILTS